MRISRRGLGVLLGGAGALVLSGGWLWRRLLPAVPAVEGLSCLDARQYRTFAALAAALFPEGGPVPPGASSIDLARAFDRFLADEPPWNQDDLRRALDMLEIGPLLFDRRLAGFSSLTPDERLAHIQSWATSSTLERRQVAVALRRFSNMVFYDRPVVWPYIGYDGPTTGGG